MTHPVMLPAPPIQRALTVPETGAAWTPQAGGQVSFLACPLFEVLLEGNRGGGKTDVLLMDFAQHIGQGWGREWKGLLLRRTYPELSDIIEKSQKWFPGMFPGCRYNVTSHVWTFATGERLTFAFAAMPKDYLAYHGKSFTWIAWEELTTWPDDSLYLKFMSLLRSSAPGIPRKYRASTNPFGPGHNWVKDRFKVPLQRGHIIVDEESGRKRVAINVDLRQNRALVDNDPDYINGLLDATKDNAAMRKAWIQGSWDIMAGGMFSDVWRSDVHIVPAFEPPRGWYIDRSYDDGSADQFAVLWWGESNGDDIILPGGTVMRTRRGDLFLLREWYGWTGKRGAHQGIMMPTREIAAGIRERELGWGWEKVHDGPAGKDIFDMKHSNSIANDFAQPVIIKGVTYPGINWQAAYTAQNSRKLGWRQVRDYMSHSVPDETGRRNRPGLFICDCCAQWIYTVPVVPRDEKDLDDVPDEVEDHLADSTRYRCYNPPRRLILKETVGRY